MNNPIGSFTKLKSLVWMAILATSLQANAQDDLSPLWQEVGRWEVRVDDTLNNGCYAVLIESTKVFRFGLNNTTGNFYVILGDVNWKSIEVGKKYDMTLEFDSEGPWSISAGGINMNGSKALTFAIRDGLFVEEMRERHNMYLRYNDEQILRMSMEGSIAALNSLNECINTFDSVTGSDKDPFSTSETDPFANN